MEGVKILLEMRDSQNLAKLGQGWERDRISV